MSHNFRYDLVSAVMDELYSTIIDILHVLAVVGMGVLAFWPHS